MSNIIIRLTNSIRKRYIKRNPPPTPATPDRDINPERVSEKIYQLLQTDSPCMIARFGGIEINCICNYLGIKKPNLIKYIQGIGQPWWWESYTIDSMKCNAGFFSNTPENLSKFSELMLHDIPCLDILASWRHEETILKKELSNVYKIELEYITPFWSSSPWTRALKGKKVLVIHPFSETIKKQYARRELIHSNPDILPPFELKIIKAVQSIGGICQGNNYKDWFEALEYMKSEIDKTDYDICIIGCGAYGFPLAAHVKRSGKKAIHMGGATQLLFGIRGKRWENYTENFNYNQFMNKFWVRPSNTETPTLYKSIEEGCYW